MPRGLAPGLLLLAAFAGAAWAQDAARFDGQYVGALTLMRTVGGDCTEPPLGAAYPLTVTGGEVRFSYVPRFATTLTGRVDAKGNFVASARVPKGVVRMTGHIQGINLTASVASPSCIYSFQTKN